MAMTAQVADVKNTLMSVYKLVKEGHKVHFERGHCYIQNGRTGLRVPVLEKMGTFEIGIWVPKSQRVGSTPNPSRDSCKTKPLLRQDR